MIFVTGGAGFIGSNFVRLWLQSQSEPLLNIDCLTYAGNLESLAEISAHPDYYFSKTDICDSAAIDELFSRFKPTSIVHFAAESHVDRSITGPMPFVTTNVVGTATLLEAARKYWQQLDQVARQSFRFVNVSTDEVFGSLEVNDPPFSETTKYSPNSPYSASKAAADHLVRAYFHTYDLPTITTNCSNNYGPYQFPEKLIPVLVCNALDNKPLPIYGDGKNVRDWLFVEDHCHALISVLCNGRPGEVYAIGGNNEKSNLDVVHSVTGALDKLRPMKGGSYSSLVTFVKDRPGHDRRYAIDARKMAAELKWQPRETFDSGIEKTVAWYLANPEWLEHVRSGSYRDWIAKNYGDRSIASPGAQTKGPVTP